MPRIYTRLPTLERLERHISRAANGCWLWTGATRTGYGTTSVGFKADGTQRQVMVHRLMYELLVGPIPTGRDLGHKCHDADLTCPGGECVHRRCVNPAHLRPETRQENLLAGRGVTAIHAAKTHCPRRHAYDESNTYISKNGTRHCKACMAQRARERHAQERERRRQSCEDCGAEARGGRSPRCARCQARRTQDRHNEQRRARRSAKKTAR